VELLETRNLLSAACFTALTLGTVNKLHDDDGEQEYRSNGSGGYAPIALGDNSAVGDVLLTSFHMNSVGIQTNDPNHFFSGADFDQLTGVTLVQITAINPNGTHLFTDGSQQYLFSLESATPAAWSTLTGLTVPAGTITAVVDNTFNNYTRTSGSQAVDIGTAVNGNLMWDFGFTGTNTAGNVVANAGLGEGWRAIAPLSPSGFATIGATESTFNGATTVLSTGVGAGGLGLNPVGNNYDVPTPAPGQFDGTGAYNAAAGLRTQLQLSGTLTTGTTDFPIASNSNAFIGPVAIPSINTSQQPPTATVGASIADKATVTGGSNPTGTVTFKLYNNPNGTGPALFTDTETLVGGTATSAGYTATATGTDYWVATYNGDSNNNAVTSGTALEPVVISPSTPVGKGQFATIGFWANKNGQAVINSFNGGSSSTALGNWLASTFPNLFGVANPYTGTSLAGKTNAQVSSIYNSLGTAGVQANTYIQAFAVALGIYADTTSLGGQSLLDNGLAAKYGFMVTAAGGGNSTFNVGNNGAAFGVPNGTSLTVFQIMAVANANFNPATGLFYGGDPTLTSDLNNVLAGITVAGEIS
jgi:hypothetical protein